MTIVDTSGALPVRKRQSQDFATQRAADQGTAFDTFTPPPRPPTPVQPPLPRPGFGEDAIWSPAFADGDERGEVL
jgi:hypothetical protein